MPSFLRFRRPIIVRMCKKQPEFRGQPANRLQIGSWLRRYKRRVIKGLGLMELVGSNRFELSTSCVSSRRSNQLSYEPTWRKTDSLTR